ncbi:hypothetical protein FEAC_27170 [Ferrimicrobium acidiphilum DSM 19497]|uniref:Uncharacterized protein n=1 Tax=Ferrimicrobium acidiphilum DSM 19497 TaxID=1121877 RepID=A0A0D8FQH1_9ACTN|nr:hypothetical protein FEAC_27170 [Ferrimicrobium acidiphilum DSM 19497]
MSRCHLGIGDGAKEPVEEIRVLPFGDLVLNHPEQKRTLSAPVLMVIDVAKVRTILEFGDRLNSVVALCPPEELGTGVGSSLPEVVAKEPSVTKTEHPRCELIDDTFCKNLFGNAVGAYIGGKDRMGSTL